MRVEYDTHGTTQHCPQAGEQVSDECLKCPFFKGSEGFVVDCCYDAEWLNEWDELSRKAEREAILT